MSNGKQVPGESRLLHEGCFTMPGTVIEGSSTKESGQLRALVDQMGAPGATSG
eukprot:CAMPEP_0194059978 /NCGR_PEP_ID=MMETSP0009_2-20130614/70537_1 /TAXON_ID=210454 /ORGANISM="Grammatophora oceanica, Strain CCMP 410" /LENGTH=52 /DNA_ID=CAMNT_0038710743 /DNA_START=103 /DNA_END=257 /DNA_ORIENTATION=+